MELRNGGLCWKERWKTEIETIFYRRECCSLNNNNSQESSDLAIEREREGKLYRKKMKIQRNGNIEKCTLRKSDEREKMEKASWYWGRLIKVKEEKKNLLELLDKKLLCKQWALLCTGDWNFSISNSQELKWMDEQGRRWRKWANDECSSLKDFTYSLSIYKEKGINSFYSHDAIYETHLRIFKRVFISLKMKLKLCFISNLIPAHFTL